MFLWQCDGQKLWATCMIGDMEYMYKYGEMYDRSGCPAGYIATKSKRCHLCKTMITLLEQIQHATKRSTSQNKSHD